VKKIVVIGGGAAGMMAAVAAATQNKDAQVTVVTGDRLPYRRPAIPALIAGYITALEGAAIFSRETLARYDIKLISPAKAESIDTKSKTITIQTDTKKENLPYDATVIATGGHPMIPKISGADKKGVCTFTTYESAAEIVEIAKTVSSAVIIGAGFIALEIAEALMHKKLDVYFNVRSRILRKLLEDDLSAMLSRKFEQQGLKMLTGETISKIGGNAGVKYVIHKGRKIETGLVVMGAGVKPNVALAEQSGIELGTTGAIKVDNHMQTSIPDIYAAGDCAESLDLGTESFTYTPVGSIGAGTGRIAGANAAGAGQTAKGFLRAQADEILGLQIFSIGHSTTTAKEVGLKVNVYDLHPPQTNEKTPIKNSFEAAKILTDSNDNIVGAQLIAQKGGSQFTSQLYKAVVDRENRKKFLEQFNSPRAKITELFLQTVTSGDQAEGPGEYKALNLADIANDKKIS